MNTRPNLSFSKLDSEAGSVLDKMFEKKDCMVEVSPGKVILPADYKSLGQDILDLEVHEDDVWMTSYPRTGSTWCQEMVWLIGHDLDYEGAKALLLIRSPIVELSCFMKDQKAKWRDEAMKGSTSVDLAKNRLQRPRYIRSHLPFHLLPSKMVKEDGSIRPKIVYTSRNPKDMVVSYYHYCQLMHGLQATFDEFCDLFMKDQTPYAPVWNHIIGFWNRRNDPNLLFIKFEEMKRDLPTVVRKTAQFLGKTLTDQQVDKLCDHLSFNKMKTNKAVNYEPIIEKSFGKDYLDQTQLRFIRKGEVGDWKNYMSEDLSRRFDEWAEQHMKGTGLCYD